jgi:transposase-like protein
MQPPLNHTGLRCASWRSGVTGIDLGTLHRERIRELERENFELRGANEILKSAAAFFGAEVDRRPKR